MGMTVAAAADNAVDTRNDAVATADATVDFILEYFPLSAIDL